MAVSVSKSRRLAKDLDRVHHGEAQHSIPIEIVAAALSDELRHRFGRIDHVKDADTIFIAHIAVLLSAVLPRENSG
jgi:hypothetical protein